MKAGKLIVLFPERALGATVLQELPRAYQLIVLVLSTEERPDFERLRVERNLDMEVIHVEGSVNDFWRKHSSVFREHFRTTRGVINFVGRDWSTMRIEEDGADWRIDPSRVENRKLALARTVLHGLAGQGRVLWINVAYGNHRPSADGQVYCGTRYGLTGFRKAVELSKRLDNVAVVDVCINYFRTRHQQGPQLHCRYCVSAQSGDAIQRARADNDFLSSVIESVERSD